MVNAGARARRIVRPPEDLSRGSDEAVFKLISSTKSREAARRMVRYVARVRPRDRADASVASVQLRSGVQEVLSRERPGEAFEETRARVDAAFDGLDLVAEAENLPAAARRHAAAAADEELLAGLRDDLAAVEERLEDAGDAPEGRAREGLERERDGLEERLASLEAPGGGTSRRASPSSARRRTCASCGPSTRPRNGRSPASPSPPTRPPISSGCTRTPGRRAGSSSPRHWTAWRSRANTNPSRRSLCRAPCG